MVTPVPAPFCLAPLEAGLKNTLKGQIRQQSGALMSWDQVLTGWDQDRSFCQWFSHTLAQAPFAAFFWETPALSVSHLPLPFEFAVINSPALAKAIADPQPFAPHLQSCQGTPAVKIFPNLGQDALLVVPCEASQRHAYTHLATFLRQAPASQILQTWQTLALTVRQRLAEQPQRPLWISTSGLGVAWLHLRLDRTPKYYQYAPYRLPLSAQESRPENG